MAKKKYIYIVFAVFMLGFTILLLTDRSAPDRDAIESISEFGIVQNESNPIESVSPLRKAGNFLAKSITELVNTKSEDTTSEKAKEGKAPATVESQQSESLQPIADGDTNQQIDIPPVINKGDIKTVDFKMLTQKGKINIIDLEGYTYLDITSLANWYGRKLSWDPDTDQFICILFGIDFRGEAFGNEIFINGRSTELSEPIYIIDNKPYIPADAFAEGVGAEIILGEELLEVRVNNIARVARTLLRS